MQKPDTIGQFIDLIKSMNHRERFCFLAAEHIRCEDVETVEIYATVLYDTGRGTDKNIKISLVDVLSKCTGKSNTINKYIRLFKPDFFEKIYSFLA